MKPTSRRHFLRLSASAAAGSTLVPLSSAQVRSSAETSAIHTLEEKMVRAKLVPLSNIRLLGGPLKAAQDADAKYLLELEPDRMMAFYRVRAGLPQKAQPYAGWDGGGRNLTGHIAGHHLSGVSLMYLATGDPKFKARADYLVNELKEVQDKQGDGY
jgi:DUF1680 family protein